MEVPIGDDAHNLLVEDVEDSLSFFCGDVEEDPGSKEHDRACPENELVDGCDGLDDSMRLDEERVDHGEEDAGAEEDADWAMRDSFCEPGEEDNENELNWRSC